MADEARSLKQYGEIPDTGEGQVVRARVDVVTVRVNEADVEIGSDEGEMDEDLITFDNVDGKLSASWPLVFNFLV